MTAEEQKLIHAYSELLQQVHIAMVFCTLDDLEIAEILLKSSQRAERIIKSKNPIPNKIRVFEVMTRSAQIIQDRLLAIDMLEAMNESES